MTVHFDTAKNAGEAEYGVEGKGKARRPSAYRMAGKRLFDLIAVLATSPILVPLVIVLAGMIRFSGHDPFFVQRRVGRDGRVFRMWKFQTMVADAERVLADYLENNPEARSEWNAHQKLKNDPRITMVGRFLRKTSLDELPQFWNVVLGDMSLVGPRPMMVDQQNLYPGDAYYRMRPGITGLWQISERNASEFSERARYDSEYESEMSFGCDLGILGRTVGVVFRGTGY